MRPLDLDKLEAQQKYDYYNMYVGFVMIGYVHYVRPSWWNNNVEETHILTVGIEGNVVGGFRDVSFEFDWEQYPSRDEALTLFKKYYKLVTFSPEEDL